jgi:uncharacterized protein YndB with AHSA1/START domain
MALAAKAANESDTTLVMTRVFDAPRERVFEAWMDPKQIALWLGTKGVRPVVKEWNPKPGAAWRVEMVGTDSGNVWTVRGVFREIMAPERLVFTWTWEHEPASDTLVTVALRAIGTKTELTLKHERFSSTEWRDRHSHGWVGSFDNMAALLAGTPVQR